MLHPGGYGEVVRQILGNHPVGDFSRLPAVEPEDQVAVPAAVGHQGGRPIGGSTGRGQEVGAARRCP